MVGFRRVVVTALLGLLPAAYAGSLPLNTIAPSTYGHSYQIGDQWLASSGLWMPSTGLDFTYQWERASDGNGTGDAPIPDANQSRYTLTVPTRTSLCG